MARPLVELAELGIAVHCPLETATPEEIGLADV
jgi:hypothetical protein